MFEKNQFFLKIRRTVLMIFKETRSLVANKTGVYLAKIITVFNKLKKYIPVGFFCKSANQVVSSNKFFLKKKKNKSFFVRGCIPILKIDGSYVKFSNNYIVFLKKRLYIKGVVTFGPIPTTIRRKKAYNSFIKKILFV